MLRSVKIGGRLFVNLDYDYAFFPKRFPKNWVRQITPAKLRRKGFKKIHGELFEKTFSDVVKLTVGIPKRADIRKSYIWTLNEQGFQKMINDLKVIQEHFDNRAQELYNRFVVREDEEDKSINRVKLVDESVRKVLASKAGMQEFQREWLGIRAKKERFMEEVLAARDAGYKMKSGFLRKYRGFLDLSLKPQTNPPYCRREYFFFDACKTRKQLHLYFEFVELFLDIFGSLADSVADKRKISPEKIKNSIFGYYVFLHGIKNIRKMYERGLSLDELRAKMPWIQEKFLEDITLDAQDKKGWAYKASDFALIYASYESQTTPGNFKQILKQEKEFAYRMRKKISRIENPKEFLSGKTDMEAEPNWYLRIEETPKKDKIALIRYALLHPEYPHRFLNVL